MNKIVTPQLRFLAACSYLPETADGQAKQRRLLEEAGASGLDPKALWNGIVRHRIAALAEEGLRRNSLKCALGEFQSALGQRAAKEKFASLRLAAESAQVSKLLADAGVGHTFVKGPLLSKKIYGDAGLRQTKDLDILVGTSDIATSIDLLKSAGWEPLRYRGMWAKSALYRWIAERRLRHFQLLHPQKKVLIELHWRLELAYAPKPEAIWRAHWDGGGGAAAISGAEFLFLCLHGALHAWIRLKWLGDIQAILDRKPHIWAETRSLARELNVESIVAQTILLLRMLFDADADEMTSEIVARQPLASELAGFALKNMQLESATTELSPATIARRLYLAKVNRRLSRCARFAHWLCVLLVDSQTVEEWERPAALLPAIPLIQVGKLAKTLFSNQKERVSG